MCFNIQFRYAKRILIYPFRVDILPLLCIKMTAILIQLIDFFLYHTKLQSLIKLHLDVSKNSNKIYMTFQKLVVLFMGVGRGVK